jgi:hypothetical protein
MIMGMGVLMQLLVVAGLHGVLTALEIDQWTTMSGASCDGCVMAVSADMLHRHFRTIGFALDLRGACQACRLPGAPSAVACAVGALTGC